MNAAIRPEPTRIPMGGVDKCLVCGWQGRPDEEHLHTIPGVPDRHTPDVGGVLTAAERREQALLAWCEQADYTSEDRDAPHVEAFFGGYDAALGAGHASEQSAKVSCTEAAIAATDDRFASHYEALGYTLGTGRLFVPIDIFHEWAERLLGRPILTHEFADENLWDELRGIFEDAASVRCAS